MKKIYENPEVEIEQFEIADILTVSATDDEGIGSGDGMVDPWD